VLTFCPAGATQGLDVTSSATAANPMPKATTKPKPRRFTDAYLDKLKPPKSGQVAYFDAAFPAFGLRIGKGGARTFILVKRVGKGRDKAPRMFALGHYPTMTLAEARAKATAWAALAEAGKDPAKVDEAHQKERERLEARQKANSFAAVAERYLAGQANKLRPKTLTGYRRILTGADLAAWADRPITDITRPDVLAVRSAIEARGKPAMARSTLVALGVFFHWAMDQDLLDDDPTARVRKGAPVTASDRVLTDDELRLVLLALDGDDTLRVLYGELECPPPRRVAERRRRRRGTDEAERGGLSSLSDTARDFIRVLLLTGQREAEVAGMAWPELHLESEEPRWELPGDRTKNKRPHIVPLAPAVVAILERRRAARREAAGTAKTPFQKALATSRFVFPSTGRGQGKTPISGFSDMKDRLDGRVAALCKVLGRAPPPPWRFHNLRHTVTTHMREAGAAKDTVEAILNHVSGARAGVAGVYDRSALLPQRRNALCQWAEKVTSLSREIARPDER
jgi:integrase